MDFFKDDRYWEKHINKKLEEDMWIKEYMDILPKSGKVLDLGCGIGQYSKFFIKNGYSVISSDVSDIALKKVQEFNSKIVKIDMREKLPFNNNEFNIVFANLSIHYFDEKTTYKLFDEVDRILKNDGLFIGSVNGIEGYEFIKDTAKEIEYHYWFYKDKYIRLFDAEDLKKYLNKFDIIKIDDKNTIRFNHNKNYRIFIVRKK